MSGEPSNVGKRFISLNTCAGRANCRVVQQYGFSKSWRNSVGKSQISSCQQHKNDQQHGISGEPFNVGKRFISLNACAGRAHCRVVQQYGFSSSWRNGIGKRQISSCQQHENDQQHGISGEPSNVGKRFISLNICAGRANCRVVQQYGVSKSWRNGVGKSQISSCQQHENDQQHGISGEPFNAGKRFISLNACAGRANCRVVQQYGFSKSWRNGIGKRQISSCQQHENDQQHGISGEPSNVGKRFISLNTCAGRANCRVVQQYGFSKSWRNGVGKRQISSCQQHENDQQHGIYGEPFNVGKRFKSLNACAGRANCRVVQQYGFSKSWRNGIGKRQISSCQQHENDQQHGISGEPFNVGKRFISLNACAGRAICRVVQQYGFSSSWRNGIGKRQISSSQQHENDRFPLCLENRPMQENGLYL